MNNSICMINKKDGQFEIGFFIYIKCNKEKVPYLMTKYDIIEECNDNSLIISLNNEKKLLKLGNQKYLNKSYNLLIIEIIGDKSDKVQFLEIASNLNKKELENYYYKQTLYIIQQNNKKDISISFGLIKKVLKSTIKFSCYVNENSKGLPIFDLTNNKIIGIYDGKSKYYNNGQLLNNIVKQLNIIEKCKNEISLLINIDKYYVNRKVYFFDNYDELHNNLKELDEYNTELYIDNIRYKYNKFFIPKKEGKFNIKIKFSLYLKDCSYMFANCYNIVYINLTGFKTKYITNMAYMFYNCYFKDIDLYSFNTQNVEYMNCMFGNCRSLKKLDISFFDFNNVEDISRMFDGCWSLVSIGDIPKWNMQKIKVINGIFKGCSSLKTLPDISEWNMKNIKDLSGLFEGCSSLKTLPDISKWNTENINDIKGIFKGCSALESLPDISEWHMKNIKDLSGLFEGCKSLKSLPDISEWNMEDNKDLRGIFKDCSSLKILPDISKWNTKNIINMYQMFDGCLSLVTLPDISKWNIENVFNINYMFYHCESLKSLPDISKWNLKKIYDIKDMFYECKKLKFLPEFELSAKPIKILFVGKEGVGCKSLIKAAITNKYLRDSYKFNFFDIIDISIDDAIIKAQFYNNSLEESRVKYLKLFLKYVDIVIFVYDTTDEKSFEFLDEATRKVKEMYGNKFMGVIIGNKIDLYLLTKIETQEGQEFAEKYNYKFNETTTKDNYSFSNCLQEIIKDYLLNNN